MKVESSGWPSRCVDDSSKDEYLKSYYDHEGIRLDKTKICNNPGRRGLAKLMLNSFWGKFGQRENMSQHSLVSSKEELYKLLLDPSVCVDALTVISDEKLLVNWTRPDSAVTPLKTVNVAIAAYTTAMARLELYKYIEKAGSQTLYFDTDSLILLHTASSAQYLPPTGDYLGCMTDELAEYGEGSYITEFVSGGPKLYALKIYSPTKDKIFTICKAKGITLNYKNSQSVNFETLKSMVLEDADPTYVENLRKITRIKDYDIVSRPERKVFRVSYTKRRRLDDDSYDTLPYGYTDQVSDVD